jgi:anion-transporting  ArsA/GET3 family ATPase
MAPSARDLLAAKEIVVACGPGGVGKTTTAAALAATIAAGEGKKVLALTVDPARRLAEALGIRGIGNVAHRVPDEAFVEAGVHPTGQLWAAMLDTRQSWDALVRRHAPDSDTAEKIIANPLYQNIAGRFAQGHEYIAMERLYELHEEGDYDLIVVDTPPTRNAIDFLDAPQRMADFFASRLLRWLTVPYRSRFAVAASKPFYQVADRILGSQLLQDLADFFILFQTMHEGFVARAEAVSRLLRDVRTTFMVVTTLEAVPAREAEVFADMLKARKLHLGLLVCNKVLPDFLVDDAVSAAATTLRSRAPELAEELAPLGGGDALQVARVLEEVGKGFANFQLVARRERDLRSEMARSHAVTATVPFFEDEITDMAGVLRIGAQVLGEAGPPTAAAPAARTRKSTEPKSSQAKGPETKSFETKSSETNSSETNSSDNEGSETRSTEKKGAQGDGHRRSGNRGVRGATHDGGD